MAALKTRTMVISSEINAVFSRMVDEAINYGHTVVACYAVRDAHCALIRIDGYSGDVDDEYDSLLRAITKIEREVW